MTARTLYKEALSMNDVKDLFIVGRRKRFHELVTKKEIIRVVRYLYDE